MDNDLACGLVGGFLNREDGARVTLVSMWVAPTHRRKGVGQRLIQSVGDWAKSHGVFVLFLLVTSNNDVAIKFYERIGFEKTGHMVPYPNDSSLFEYEMKKIIS
jgi:ribosomal protein S18 acetylase RimI-like enzyme